jgi:hypothetical protein
MPKFLGYFSALHAVSLPSTHSGIVSKKKRLREAGIRMKLK